MRQFPGRRVNRATVAQSKDGGPNESKREGGTTFVDGATKNGTPVSGRRRPTNGPRPWQLTGSSSSERNTVPLGAAADSAPRPAYVGYFLSR